MSSHLPDLKNAPAWLNDMRTEFLGIKEAARVATNVDGSITGQQQALARFCDAAERHAATLEDILARAEIGEKPPERNGGHDRQLLDALMYILKPEDRATIMRRVPEAYNAYVGREVVKVVRADGTDL